MLFQKRFPKTNEVWRKMLINIIRESRNENDWLPSKSSVICSDHFDTEDLYTTKEGRLKVTTYAVPKKLLSSNLQKIQKQQTPTMPTPTPRPTILQESSNVEGVAKAPLTSTTLSTISTQSQVPVFEKVYVKEELIEYCRLCAASDCDGGLLNLQSDDSLKNLVVKMVKRLNTYIDFSQEHLPTTICPACVKALYTAYDFVVGIDQAQITLNNKLIQNDIRQMPGNRNLDNNLNSSSTSLQQISTNEGTEANDFEQKPLPMPSTSVLLPQVSTNNAPATSKIEQPPVIESKLNLPYLLDSVEKRWKYSYDLKKERQKIERQKKKVKTLNQKIRRLHKRNELLKKKLITLRKNNTDANQAKKVKNTLKIKISSRHGVLERTEEG